MIKNLKIRSIPDKELRKRRKIKEFKHYFPDVYDALKTYVISEGYEEVEKAIQMKINTMYHFFITLK